MRSECIKPFEFTFIVIVAFTTDFVVMCTNNIHQNILMKIICLWIEIWKYFYTS